MPLEGLCASERPRSPTESSRTRLTALLASGGDERIALDPLTGRNRYGAAPWPTSGISYASSTANDLSAAALAHLLALGDRRAQPSYGDRLEDMRHRLRAVYRLGGEVEIVFARSGTDLEFAALAIAAGRFRRPVCNILLGADEVGSGCVMAARGRHFSAAGSPCGAGESVEGLGERTSIAQVALRDATGRARCDGELAADCAAAIARALACGRTPLLHVVHGSKLGLRAPAPAVLDWLVTEFGAGMAVVVDACQARLDAGAIAGYLDQGFLVMLTGSKFAGGPPFSGMLLVPSDAADGAARLPPGLAKLFSRSEWPRNWSGAGALDDGANPGLALRLEAALFELERFAAIPQADRERIIAAFAAAVRQFARIVGAAVLADGAAEQDPFAQTLRVLDFTGAPGVADLDGANRLHRRLMDQGFRFGQPVRLAAGREGALRPILRTALSMPQIVGFAAMERDRVRIRLDRHFATAAGLIAEQVRETIAVA